MMAPSSFHFGQIDQELLSSGTAARRLMVCAMGGAIGVEREVRGKDQNTMLAAVLGVLNGAGERLNVLERDCVASLERVAFLVTAEQGKHERLLAALRAADATDQVVVFRDAEEE